MIQPPETRYARSGDLHIAYQVIGDGPRDLVMVPGFVSNVETVWEVPAAAEFLRRLASFSRLILFDKRGTGLSDRVPVSALPTSRRAWTTCGRCSTPPARSARASSASPRGARCACSSPRPIRSGWTTSSSTARTPAAARPSPEGAALIGHIEAEWEHRRAGRRRRRRRRRRGRGVRAILARAERQGATPGRRRRADPDGRGDRRVVTSCRRPRADAGDAPHRRPEPRASRAGATWRPASPAPASSSSRASTTSRGSATARRSWARSRSS